ncbi:MAG: SMC-Scp complex subunit ScpB [Candidatus Obscuribacterales bacterium]|nr:SMC-Scp complex subunit ScpB [Candidatus Obscuribacterales bacterium]
MENNLKAKVEAALFLTEKPVKASAVAKIVGEDLDKVRRTILELIRDYEERDLGLEIADDNGYIIQVKDEFATLIDEFVPLEIPTSLIRTLSAIAIKQPVMQSEIIKIRGAGAYEHIKELMERDLVNKKEEGRSPTLTTTKRFQEYFRLSKDGKSLRQILIRQDKEAEAELEGDNENIENSESTESIENNSFDASPDQNIQQTLNFGLEAGNEDNDTSKEQSAAAGPAPGSEAESQSEPAQEPEERSGDISSFDPPVASENQPESLMVAQPPATEGVI